MAGWLRMVRHRKCWKKGEGRNADAAEKGFAMVMVLVALTMLAILGAASLLLMVSSMEGVGNKKPEDRAFQIAESALYVAHARIVNEDIPPSVQQPIQGSLLGGDYRIWIEKTSLYDYTVTAEGLYRHQGRTFRRKLREDVYYSGTQAFDVLRNYLIFAGNDVNISCDEFLNANIPIRFNGNIRAQRDVNIENRPIVSLGDGFTVNGNVEARRKIYLRVAPRFFGELTVRYYGDMKTGDKKTNSPGTTEIWVDGQASLFPPAFSWARVYAATTGSRNWNIYTGTLIKRINQLFGWDLGAIYTGNVVNQPGCDEVYIPEPNYEYYRALAQEQGNYFVGNKTLSGNLGSYGTSSVTVFYVTGNLTINGFAWNQPNMKGIFVCEGNVTVNNNLQFWNNSKFQVIAKGNITFNNDWTFLSLASTNEFFFYAGGDVTVDLRMFGGQKCQITALRNVNIYSSENAFSFAELNYMAPDIDVAAFPIKLTVRNWREVPSEGAYLERSGEKPLYSAAPVKGPGIPAPGWAVLPDRRRLS